VDYAITNTKTNPNPRNFLKFVEIEMEEDVGGQQAPFINTVRLVEKATFDLKLTKNCQKLMTNLITVQIYLTRGE